MAFHWHPSEQVRIGRYLFKWTILASIVGVLAGCASAVFLISLDWATRTRLEQPWLVYCLPLGGLLIGLCYHYLGKGVEGGNNLLLDEIHKPQSGVPTKMAPLILLSTVATHLFGGSAGREGTAVQMGGSMASWFARRIGLDAMHARILLMAGISGGFGSVFGTPLAGMIFGLEVLAVGRLRYDALIPCLVASLVGDWTCHAWGVQHMHYAVEWAPILSAPLIAKVLLASLAFALASVLFAELTHLFHWIFKQLVPWAPARPALGGLALLGLVWLVGTRDYLGLGLPLLVGSFQPESAASFAFAIKILFTAVTLGSGFKGGEVTPLFVIGATLGATLGHLLGVPPTFMAALGFVAVFAGAANTPLACTVMGIELFGSQYGIYLGLACCSAYIWSGHRGIYPSQVIDTPKTDDEPHLPLDATLLQAREAQPPLRLSIPSLVRPRWSSRRRDTVPLSLPGESGMKLDGRLAAQKVGLVRIYLSHRDKRPAQTWTERFLSRPLYQDIIHQARDAGLTSATAKGMPYGFTRPGAAVENNYHPELGTVEVHIYVELIGPRDKLEAFLLLIAPLIENRVVVYKEVEHWNVPKLHIAPETAPESAQSEVV